MRRGTPARAVLAGGISRHRYAPLRLIWICRGCHGSRQLELDDPRASDVDEIECLRCGDVMEPVGGSR